MTETTAQTPVQGSGVCACLFSSIRLIMFLPGKWKVFLRLKQLQHQLWLGQKFQRYCLRIGCPNLAMLEEENNRLLVIKIRNLKEQAARASKTFEKLRNNR